MLVVIVLATAALVAGLVAWVVLQRWSPDPGAPRVRASTVAAELEETPRARTWVARRTDPNELTGLALSFAVVGVVAGATVVGVLLLMVRGHGGLTDVDPGVARFAARHATPASTRTLRVLTQFGGAVVLVPATALFAGLAARRQHAWKAIIGFLTVTVGGQFALANVIKLAVDRARPAVARLTGFSSSSFPSGHATAAAATFAAIGLVAGRGRSRATRARLGGLVVGGAVAVAGSRVMLGVHWLTDVTAGLALGWGWFALVSMAFGGRLLRFGAPAEAATAPAGSPTPEPEPVPARGSG